MHPGLGLCEIQLQYLIVFDVTVFIYCDNLDLNACILKTEYLKKWELLTTSAFMKETSERIIFFRAFSTNRNINMILLFEITFKIGFPELNL